MTVGYRFCGGCNSGYDRAEALRMLAEGIYPLQPVLCRAGDGENPDLLVLLCGCGARCVECGDISSTFIYIVSENDVQNAVNAIIREAQKNGQGQNHK